MSFDLKTALGGIAPTVATMLAGLLAAAPIAALEQQGNTLVLSDEERAQCRAEGGCSLVTNNAVRLLVEKATQTCPGLRS